jgi:putative radical SAM enzyme (TIGR03279 family)
LTVRRIHPGSPASRAGLRAGDRVTACGGSQLGDWLDFCMHAAGHSVRVTIDRGGASRSVGMTRDPGVGWGLEFAGQEPRICRNRCVFCFVDQQPPGLRDSLLVRDDDVRCSFFHGTYVTLDEVQAEEAVSRGLSPVHVSVHASDPLVRGRLLGRRGPAPVIPQVAMLSDHGLEVEAQIVVIPGMNDGPVLEETVEALYVIPGVKALGVVPVGLTRWREGLPVLRRPDGDECTRVIGLCDRWRERSIAERGTGWVYAADEFFLMSGRDIPPADYYEGCSLESNGIGLLARAAEENRRLARTGSGTVCTGSLAFGHITSLLGNTGYDVVLVENHLFGPMVGVAGLLSGGDIVRRLAGSACPAPVYLPGVMFNHEMRTLDGMTPRDLARETGLTIEVAGRLSELP